MWKNISMDSKIKCLKCGSYIHDTERCWNWHEITMCSTDKKFKENCDCNICKTKNLCIYCNSLFCYCINERCVTCNEHLKINNVGVECYWDHSKPPCQFCKLPIIKIFGFCPNYHEINKPLCKICNMPEVFTRMHRHRHDGSTCKKCGTLLNNGRCIYKCNNGGNFCIYCCSQNVVDDKCLRCCEEQSGSLTKAAIK